MKRLIDFLKVRYIAFGLSTVAFIVFSSGTYLNNGLNLGIDFAGGVKSVIKFEKGIDSAKIRSVLTASNINAVVQQMGKEEDNEYIVSSKLLSEKESSEEGFKIIKSVLDKGFKNINILSVESVGPAIGKYLLDSAIYSLVVILILITLYLAFRFEFKYSVGAIVAVLHDIFLSLLFCGMMNVEMNIPVVAAILFIFGYSVNDTIVIFDRIRENVNVKSKQTFHEIINKSITQSMSRTLLTSLTTLFAILALYLLGGDTLKSFAFVLLFGIIVGTYSSIYVASPSLLLWEKITTK